MVPIRGRLYEAIAMTHKIVMRSEHSDRIYEHEYIAKEDGRYYIKQCRGCKTYEDGMNSLTEEEKDNFVYLCNVSVPIKQDTGELCPCSLCIIKMVCAVKCEPLSEFIESPIKVGDEKS